MNISLFLTRSHLSPNLVIRPTIFASFAVSVHTSIPKTASTIATSIVHSKLDTATLFITTCPSLRSPRLQQIQNSLARAVVKAPKSSHITRPILRSLHWLKITELIEYLSSSHLPTKFSQPPNLHICVTSSQFSLLAALALHLWSHSLVHSHHLLYEQIVLSSMPPLVSGSNSRLPSVNHALISPILHHPVLSVARPPSVSSTHHFYG